MAIALAEADKYEILEKIGKWSFTGFCHMECLLMNHLLQAVAPSASSGKSSASQMDS